MSQKPYHSQTLDEIRQKIDALDTRIHDTLVERAELVLKIGEEKRKNNIEVVQPAREARMIRRLLSKENGVLPEMAVVRIWRELVGAVSLLQTGLKVTVAEEPDCPEYWDLAKDYFGSCLPMTRSASPISAINAVRDGRATFAVVPYPNEGVEQENETLWWENLGAGSDNTLSIIVRLPHGDDPNNENPDYRALVIAKSGFDDSDEDHSFIFIQSDPSLSRGKIVSLAEEAGLKPVGLTSKPVTEDSVIRNHLLEVEGYHTNECAHVTQFSSLFEDGAQVSCVGGYPVPPVYSKTILPPSQEIPKAPKA
ncbi:MAG: chorismate mutase [Alphaproteobacteria bacterium]|nr:chorismate mutase [Alphaproteobacteria bacterium]